MECATQQQSRSLDEILGVAKVYEVCAEALLNLPTKKIIGDVIRVAEILESDAFDGITFDDTFEQRYYDRFFVPSSPWFIPLSESCIRGAHVVDGVWHFGLVADAGTDHVAACYTSANFDPTDLQGFDLAVQSLRGDSLAAELSFMAYLAQQEAVSSPEKSATHVRSLEEEFLKRHMIPWVGKGAEALVHSDDDFYARFVAFAAAWIEFDYSSLT